MNEKDIRRRQVDMELGGQRLDRAAGLLFPGYSRARLQQWIRSGALTVDGAPAKPGQRLAGGESLRLEICPEPETAVRPQDIPLDILFEDAHILIIDKPADFVVHPAAGNPDSTLQNALLAHDPDLASIPRAGIVHRLDKDTTGVMVVARSLRAHAHLVGQLQERRMGRVYEAVVHGIPEPEGRIDAPIGRNPRDRKKMAVVAGGKTAVTYYRVLRAFRHFAHLEATLESGRTHQIRVHMQHIGNPLVGDPQYGRRALAQDLPAEVREAVNAFPRQALHARTLRLLHPPTGEERSFDSPLPADMAGLLGVLERFDR